MTETAPGVITWVSSSRLAVVVLASTARAAPIPMPVLVLLTVTPSPTASRSPVLTADTSIAPPIVRVRGSPAPPMTSALTLSPTSAAPREAATESFVPPLPPPPEEPMAVWASVSAFCASPVFNVSAVTDLPPPEGSLSLNCAPPAMALASVS